MKNINDKNTEKMFKATIRRTSAFNFIINSEAFDGEDCGKCARSCRVTEEPGMATVMMYGTGSGIKYRRRQDWKVRNAKSGNSYLGLTPGMQNVVLHISIPIGYDSEDKIQEIVDELKAGYKVDILDFELNKKEV